MKPYLLIVNEGYYPAGGTSDWQGTFETEEEAEEAGNSLKTDYNFFNVVDLRDWIGIEK